MVHMSFILVLKSLRQKDHEWEVCLGWNVRENERKRQRWGGGKREKREREWKIIHRKKHFRVCAQLLPAVKITIN